MYNLIYTIWGNIIYFVIYKRVISLVSLNHVYDNISTQRKKSKIVLYKSIFLYLGLNLVIMI